MENSKLNLLDFGHALGREEMKKLMAGSGTCGSDCFSIPCDQYTGCPKCAYLPSGGGVSPWQCVPEWW